MGVIIYSNALKGPFVYDDFHSITDNPYIKQPSLLSSLFDLSYVTHPSQARSIYRPVLMFTFFLNYAFGSFNPIGYHLVNIFLHIMNGFLVFFLIKELLGPAYIFRERIALFSALIFISHPVQTETVNYIICRSELLAGFFLLLSFSLYIKAVRSTKERYSFYRASLIAFGLGLLSKETALMLPLIIFFYECLFIGWKNFKEFLWRLKRYYSFFAVMAVIYILLRTFLLGNFLGKLSISSPVRPLFINLLTQAKVCVFYYLRLLFFPFGLSIDHYVPVAKPIFEFPVLMSIILIIILLASAFILRRKNKAVSFFILWFFINLIPTGIIPLHIIMNEHRLYLSTVSFGFLVSLALISAPVLKKNRNFLVS